LLERHKSLCERVTRPAFPGARPETVFGLTGPPQRGA